MKKASMKIKISASLICLLFLACCQCNYTRINDQDDENDASKIADKFYVHYALHDFKNIHKLMSRDFFSATDTAKLDSALGKLLRKYGGVRDHTIIDFSSKSVSGTNSGDVYELLYKVTYINDSTKELFRMEKIDNAIKIVAYSVNHEEI